MKDNKAMYDSQCQSLRAYERSSAFKRGLKQAVASAAKAVADIHATITADIASTLEQLRLADEYAQNGHKAALEYSTNTNETSETDFGCGYRLHNPSGNTCDCELSETERTLVSIATHEKANAEEPIKV